MAETLAQTLVELFQDKIPPELTAFVISLLPILECRGGMIAARLLEMPFLKAFVICYLGNMLPIPFILLFLKKIFELMKKSKGLGKIVHKMEKKAEKHRHTIEKYGTWGLLALVAIPLPGTGGWTGALVAEIMDIKIKKGTMLKE